MRGRPLPTKWGGRRLPTMWGGRTEGPGGDVGSLPTMWGGRPEGPGGDVGSFHIGSSPDCLDKSADLVTILHSHRGLHPARHIDAVRLVPAHDRAHVTRFESTGDEDLASLDEIACQLPRPRAPRAAALVARP